MSGVNSNTERDDYLAWTAAVYAGLQSSLGGDAAQGGSDRTFGDGRFGHEMSGELGDVTFIVSRPSDLLRRSRTVGPFEWRAISAERVVEALLAVFRELEGF